MDKKLTDNEIIKALENVAEWFTEHGKNTNTAVIGISKQAIDLINRQRAEIERLKQIVGFTPARGSRKSPLLNAVLDNVRAEAVKEFAERSEKELFIKQNEHREHWMETLNRHRGTEAYKDHEWSIDNWLRGYGEAVQDILGINQEFLKELVGEDDG